jgi:hypothetical protein
MSSASCKFCSSRAYRREAVPSLREIDPQVVQRVGPNIGDKQVEHHSAEVSAILHRWGWCTHRAPAHRFEREDVQRQEIPVRVR